MRYYSQTSGYREYLTDVDKKVLAPEARAEMKRGGESAYRYITDAMNDEVFQAGATR